MDISHKFKLVCYYQLLFFLKFREIVVDFGGIVSSLFGVAISFRSNREYKTNNRKKHTKKNDSTWSKLNTLPLMPTCRASWFIVKSQVTDLLGDNFYECNGNVFARVARHSHIHTGSTHMVHVPIKTRLFRPAITSNLIVWNVLVKMKLIDLLAVPQAGERTENDENGKRNGIFRFIHQLFFFLSRMHLINDRTSAPNDFILQMVNFIIQFWMCICLRLNKKNVSLFFILMLLF